MGTRLYCTYTRKSIEHILENNFTSSSTVHKGEFLGIFQKFGVAIFFNLRRLGSYFRDVLQLGAYLVIHFEITRLFFTNYLCQNLQTDTEEGTSCRLVSFTLIIIIIIIDSQFMRTIKPYRYERKTTNFNSSPLCLAVVGRICVAVHRKRN